MKTIISLTFISGSLLLAGCAHVASTTPTFVQEPNKPLVLKLARHVDQLMSGPDIEEDQTLIIELTDVAINERVPVPSAKAKVRLVVERFGPASEGVEFVGYVIVRKAEMYRVLADVHLDVQARTADGSYKQTTKFRGDQVFEREEP